MLIFATEVMFFASVYLLVGLSVCHQDYFIKLWVNFNNEFLDSLVLGLVIRFREHEAINFGGHKVKG